MRPILFVLALSAIFASCSSNGTAGKKDTIVIRDTVTALSDRPTRHVARKEKGYETNAPGNEPANKSYTPNANQPATADQPVTTAPQQNNPRKKGWSAAAKDATIGGAAGAAAGAILDKNNRWVGGAIGAAIGSGAGYLIGRARDRKTGRIVKHKPVDTSYYSNQH